MLLSLGEDDADSPLRRHCVRVHARVPACAAAVALESQASVRGLAAGALNDALSARTVACV